MDLSADGSTVVEVFRLGVRDAALTYRISQHRLGGDVHPDALARRLAGFHHGNAEDGRVLHSTSWRFDAGRIVLTYVALPDPEPGDATVLDGGERIAVGDDPLAPSPAHVNRAEIAAHACRHLAFLRRTDPVIAAAAVRQPRLWALLDDYRPDLAGDRAATARSR